MSEPSFRPINAEDVPVLQRWISADPEHRDYYQPEFWSSAPAAGEMKFAATDEDGKPIAFVKIEMVARLYVQFPPTEEMGKFSLTKRIRRGCERMFQGLWELGIREVIFGTVPGSALQRFMRRAFIFGPMAEGTESRRF